MIEKAEWISLKDVHPRPARDVLIYLKDRTKLVAYYSDGGWWNSLYSIDNLLSEPPLFWMPLPADPVVICPTCGQVVK